MVVYKVEGTTVCTQASGCMSMLQSSDVFDFVELMVRKECKKNHLLRGMKGERGNK